MWTAGLWSGKYRLVTLTILQCMSWNLWAFKSGNRNIGKMWFFCVPIGRSSLFTFTNKLMWRIAEAVKTDALYHCTFSCSWVAYLSLFCLALLWHVRSLSPNSYLNSKTFKKSDLKKIIQNLKNSNTLKQTFKKMFACLSVYLKAMIAIYFPFPHLVQFFFSFFFFDEPREI